MPAGRPTKYNEDMLAKTKAYYLSYKEAEPFINGDNKLPNPKFKYPPYIEELSLELDVDEDTIGSWGKKFPEFLGTIKRIKTLQKLRLLHSSMAKSSTTGSIFQLKVNHNMIETNRQELTGKDGEQLVGFNYLPPNEHNTDT